MATVGDIVEVVDKLRDKNKALKGVDFTKEQLQLIYELGDIVASQIGIDHGQTRKERNRSVVITEEAEEILYVLQSFLSQTHPKQVKEKETKRILVRAEA